MQAIMQGNRISLFCVLSLVVAMPIVMPVAVSAAPGLFPGMVTGSEVVAGAPYSATAVTESEQRFWDGNRIVQRTVAEIHRDGAGRTRSDQSPVSGDPLIADAGVRGHSILMDPVAGTLHVLDHQSRTRHSIPLPAPAAGPLALPGRTIVASRRIDGLEPPLVEARVPALRMSGYVSAAVGDPPVEESLGMRSFDGIEAEGSQTTVTIPAGAIGNEWPIEIVSERWYAPELGVVLMTRQTDPRVGETVYRLENIRRGEPPSTLFGVPDDYADAGPRMQPVFRSLQQREEEPDRPRD